jgi:hypothetical protein
MIDVRSARRRARTSAFVGSLLLVLALVAACSVSRRNNGEACLKDEDCVSGICAGGVCVAQAPLLDAAVDAEAGPPTIDASDAATDAPADTKMSADSGMTKDSGRDSANEAASDSMTPSEAGGDSTTD